MNSSILAMPRCSVPIRLVRMPSQPSSIMSTSEKTPSVAIASCGITMPDATHGLL